MAKQKTFLVDVQRISYSAFVTIEVQAKNAKEAARKANDAAGDQCFEEESAEYNIDEVREA